MSRSAYEVAVAKRVVIRFPADRPYDVKQIVKQTLKRHRLLDDATVTTE